MADGRNGRQREYCSRLQSEFAGKVAGNDGGLGACANNEGRGRFAVDADLNRHAIAAVNVDCSMMETKTTPASASVCGRICAITVQASARLPHAKATQSVFKFS